MQFVVKPFDHLSLAQLFAVYVLRSRVFVVEQNCPYQDPDEYDPKAYHVLMLKGKELVGYARLLPPGLCYTESAIGRVVVDKEHRGQQFGESLMKFCIQQNLDLFKGTGIVISAQLYLLKFYSRLGFESQGHEFLEDNIPHIKMRYSNNAHNIGDSGGYN